jgi:HK97 family phage major capsid protein
MSGATVGAVRKLKDQQGQFLFSPSLSADQRDMLLGVPIIENPAIAAAGTGVRSAIVGHMPSYYTRMVGGIRLDRSDEYAFNQDLVTFRASARVDGNLPQSSHIKAFIGGTA